MRNAAILCLLSGAAFGQTPPPNNPEPTNIDFSQGATGQIPFGWEVARGALDAGYRAELREERCGERFRVCAAFSAPSEIGEVRNANLSQSFPAAPYIGKSVRFSAWLRMAKASNGGYMHIRMRINYADGKSELRDSVQPPVDSGEWQRREVFGHVDQGAATILIWIRYVASGDGWAASPEFGVVDDAKVPVPPSFGVATGTFPVKEASGHTIRFGAWIKTEEVTRGYAGLWWRVDGEKQGQMLAFDNSSSRVIDGKPGSGDGTVRGATGTSNWTWYEIELPVATQARNINFGFLLDGNGTAWFDAARIEVDGVPYLNSDFDFDFESPGLKGFWGWSGGNSGRYIVDVDKTVAYTGQQSLKMRIVDPKGPPKGPTPKPEIRSLDPFKVDEDSRSTDYSTPVTITFVNRSSSPVDIYWIDYEGHRELKASNIAVGKGWRTSTFLTHPWLVVASGTGGTKERGTGVRIAAFEASGPAGGNAIIEDHR